MNLVLITQDFPPEIGGIETFSFELAKRFAKRCNYFTVFAPKAHGADSVDKKVPFRVHRLEVSNTMLAVALLPYLPNHLYRNHIDVAFHSQWQTLPASVWASRKGYPRKIFVAAHARELLLNPFGDDSLFGKQYIRYRKYLLKQVYHFFAMSDYTRGLLLKNDVPEDKISVVGSATDPLRFYPANARRLKEKLNLVDKKILLTITRLVPRKGMDTVIRALPELVHTHPDIMYIIGGSGEYRQQLERLASRLDVEDYVIFAGRIADEDLIKYYNMCDILVMPSKTMPPDVEGFGLVFLEANACKKPVIGSTSGGIPDAVVHGETGLLIEERNIYALKQAVDTLLGDLAYANQLGKNGFKRVQKKYNWDTLAERLFTMMQKSL